MALSAGKPPSCDCFEIKVPLTCRSDFVDSLFFFGLELDNQRSVSCEYGQRSSLWKLFFF